MMNIHAITKRHNIQAGRLSLQKKSEIPLASVIIARSTSLIFSRIALGSFRTFNLLALRFGVAFIILAAIFARRLISIKWRELLAGVLLGVMFTALLSPAKAVGCALIMLSLVIEPVMKHFLKTHTGLAHRN